MLRKKGLVALTAMLLIAAVTPALAAPLPQEEEAVRPTELSMWIAVAAAFGMAIASGLCGLAQGRSVAAACEGIARNPNAAGLIRGSLIIGLILIESLAIYTLLIALLLIYIL